MAGFEDDKAAGALAILDYLSDLFTGSKLTFSREEVLMILNIVKNDPELFRPDDVVRWDGE